LLGLAVADANLRLGVHGDYVVAILDAGHRLVLLAVEAEAALTKLENFG